MPKGYDPPRWVSSLSSVGGIDDWLKAIGDAADPAVEGLLHRHQLPKKSLRSARLQQIQTALKDGRLTQDNLQAWRDEVQSAAAAVDGIRDFRSELPLLQDFSQDHKLDNGNADEIKNAVVNALWRDRIPLRSWVNFLDQRRDQVDRHLFLYRLPGNQQQKLDVLRDRDRLRERLRSQGCEDVLEAQEFVWRTPSPRLVSAQYDRGGRRLTLRWVGWRDLKLGDPSEPDPLQIGKRRCVTFLRLDLDNGDIELQLQRLRRGGMSPLVAERDLYIKAAVEVLGFWPERLRLEPPMRGLLSDRRMHLHMWKVRLQSGGELGGKHEPGLFAKVNLAFRQFYALQLSGSWREHNADKHPLQMDARTDAINIFHQCQPVQLEVFVSAVRGLIEPRLAEPDGGSSDDPTIAESQMLIERLIAYHRRLGRTEVAVERLTTHDVYFSDKLLRGALDKIGVRYLGATFYILCPLTDRPVRQAGKVVEFERLHDVPQRILCENEPGKAKHHETESNVWLRVGHREKPPAASLFRGCMITAVYVVSVSGVTWFYIELFEAYTDLLVRGFITGGWLITVLGPLALIRKELGLAVEWAGGFLAKLFPSLFGKSGARS